MAEIDLRLDEIYHLCDGKGDLCRVRYCRRTARPDGRLCGTHHVAAWRKRNPTKAAWKSIKDRATRLNIEFNIPFEAFKEICERTGYIEGKGSRPENLALDRIKNWLGYTLDNVRVVTVEVNGRKGYYEGKLKLSTGQQVLWDQIGIDEHLREVNDRKAQFNPYPKAAEVCDAMADEEDDPVPEWLRDSPTDDQSNSDDPF